MRSWAPRLGVVLCSIPVIAVVGVSAAEAPGSGVLDSSASAQAEDGAPPNATPPNPDSIVDATARADQDGVGTDGREKRRAKSRQDAGADRDSNATGGGKQQQAARAAHRDGGGPAPGAGPRDGAGSAQAARTSGPQPNDTWDAAPPPDPASCPIVPRAVVVDRTWQRAWLCSDGLVGAVLPVTTARDQPDPGDYPIYAMDWQSFSDTTPERSWLDRFIAFTYGKNEGLRIGFHAVPYYDDGTLLQPLSSVGSQKRFGDSDGCIRVLPEHAELLYGYLQDGDIVRVLT